MMVAVAKGEGEDAGAFIPPSRIGGWFPKAGVIYNIF